MTDSTNNPMVTVIIPCFNTAPYLLATLQSVQAQTFRGFEVIMVDDGSTDGTLAIMQDFATRQPRCTVIPLQTNQGIVAARNAALAKASGEYVAMLDGDDIWTPDALDVRLQIAKNFPAAEVVATDFAFFENEIPSRPIGRVSLGPRCQHAFASCYTTQKPILLNEPFELTATTYFAWVGATLVRRIAMERIGNFNPEFVGPEDTLLWLSLAQRGAFAFSPKITAFYRQRPGSITALWKDPVEIHHLKVFDWIRNKPQFNAHRRIIRKTSARHHYTCSQRYRSAGDSTAGFDHALAAVKNQPLIWQYWRNLVGAMLDAVRR